ncbi:ubiE/COQ5 methyltransferase [Mactra antiquata]
MDSPATKKSTKTHWFCYNSNYYKGMKTGDELDEEEERKTREFMAKYMANYRAHRKGMTPEEVAEYYTEWSVNGSYDQDLDPETYQGPKLIADEAAECFTEKREKLRFMDIACGTGRVGVELSKHGFKNIDGLDPSSGMLKQCEKRHIYKHLYKEFIDDKTLPIDDGIYDCLVISGGLGESHIPCSGLNEMIRIVKPGGLILIVMRKEYLKYVDEYTDRLEPYIARLEHDNKLEVLERKEVPKYSFDRDGIIFKMKVKKSSLPIADVPTKSSKDNK